MAVWCGVCGTQLDGAWENDGPFQVSKDFDHGWDTDEKTEAPRISDTCGSCAKVLRSAVANAATEIAKTHQVEIQKLKMLIKDFRERRALAAKEKADFEEAWNAQRRRSP
jgi:hypothetical protein